jgi:hypothetical protein
MATNRSFVAKNGLDNNGNPITGAGTVGSSLQVSGAHALTFTLAGPTTVSLPTSGTLVTSTQISALSTATSANTPNTIVQRDGSGNFSAGTVTLTGLTTSALSVSTSGIPLFSHPTAIQLELREGDQTLPAGRWRFTVDGDILSVRHNTAVAGDFTTYVSPISFSSTNNVTIPNNLLVSGTITGTLSGNASTATALQTGRTFSVSGDATGTSTAFTGTADATIPVTLATVNSNVGSFGTASQVSTFTVNAKGLITAASNTNIAIAAGAVTSGTFADARIAASNVTQHQAALTIAETQITDGALLARNAGNETISGTWTFSNNVTVPLVPTADSHAASKQYVDNMAAGVAPQESVRAATTAAITLSGTQTVDGVALIAGDRVLVKDQGTASQNGIYVVAAGAWTRATDFDGSPTNEVTQGDLIFVELGTVNANTSWVLLTANPITVGTSALNFSIFSRSADLNAGNGLTRSGNTINVVTASTARIVVNADNIDLATAGTAGTYRSVTTDAYGRVTAGTNPTTLSGYGITDAQPLDADLTAIAGLVGTSGLLRKVGTDSWSLDTATYLTGNQSISLTGDATGTGATSIAVTLANTAVTPASYGSATQVGTFTVDSKGRLTAASNTTIAIPTSAVTSGTFANARIAASNVTQHQAALTIAETQITDGALLARVGDDETISGNWAFSNNVTVPLVPTALAHAASKQYVDNSLQGLQSKPSVRAATTANLTATYSNGSAGVGATLTGTGTLPTIDGVTLTTGDGVLVKNQTASLQNGRYNVTTVSPNWVLTRCGLCDENDEIPGAYIFVTDGSTLKNTGWVLSVASPSTFVVGTDAITVVQFSGAGEYTAGAGLALFGNTFSVGTASAARIVVNADTIDLATVGTAGTYRSVTTDAYGRVTAGTNPTTLSGYGITDAQPLDADLTSIAGLAGTSGLLRKTAANTWSLDTNTYITGNETITLSGDVTGSGSTAITATLANTAVTAGSYGTASQVPTITVDSKGRLTAASNTAIAIAATAVTSGTFNNARIAASNVTQHQAALTILESQITDGTVLARNAGDEAISGNWTFNNNVAVPLVPTADGHAASKQYVDNAITGLDMKQSVHAATTANITLSGTQTVDGVALIAGDRVLVKNQTTASQNGIYVVSAGSWTRSIDADDAAEVTSGLYVFVEEGTANGDTGWVLSTNDPITIGTTALTFVQFSGLGQVTAGAGMTKTGNTLDVGTASTARIVVNADNIDLATVTDGGGGSFLKFTRDTYGRVTGTSAVVAADINSLVSTTYVTRSADTMTGALGVVAGTAGAPGLYIVGDTNTGINQATGADTLAISTGGTNRLVVNSIGTAINASGNAATRVQFELGGNQLLTGSAGSYIGIGAYWDTGWKNSVTGNGGIVIRNESGGTMQFMTGDSTEVAGTVIPGFTTRMAINGAGQVSISSAAASTSTATGALTVAGGVGVGGAIYAASFNGPLTGNVTGNVTGTVSGNAGSATVLQTTRTFNLSGVTTGGAQNFNGSQNVVINVTAVPTSLLTGVIADAQISGAYSGITNLSMSGNLTITSSSASQIFMNSPTVQGAYQFTQVGGLNRWVWGANSTAETGSNAGSNFFIQRYTDAGAIIDVPLSITRSSGQVVIPNGSGIAQLNASNLSSGTVADARLSSNVALLNATQTFTGQKTFNQALLMGSTTLFNINGSTPGGQINGLYVADLGGTVGTTNNPTFTAAIAGQIDSSRSVAVSVDGAGNLWGFRSHSSAGTYVWNSKVVNADQLTTARTIALSGAATGTATSFNGSANITIPVTALNASNLTTGTVPTARLGTGTADSTTYLRGDGTWAAGIAGVTSITIAGSNGIGVSNPTITSTGTVTLSLGDITPTTVRVPDGTVALPSITFASDLDTGIYRSGTNILAFTTGGTQAMTLDASGNTNIIGRLGVLDGTPNTSVVANLAGTFTANAGRYGIQNLVTLTNEALTTDRTSFGAFNRIETQVQNGVAFSLNIEGARNLAQTSAAGGNSIDGEGALIGATNYALHQTADVTFTRMENVYGAQNLAIVSGATAIGDNTYGSVNTAQASGAGSIITTAMGVRSRVIASNATSSITTGHLFYGDMSATGTITNRYGLYIATAINNYVAGGFQIAGTAATGTNTHGLGVGIAPSGTTGTIRTSSQIFTYASDTVSAPGYSWDGDPNTGMFRPAEDILAFTAGGTETMRLEPTQVLIGATTGQVTAGTDSRVQIHGLTNALSSLSIARHNADASGALLYLGKSRATSVGGITAVVANDILGNIIWAGGDNAAMSSGATIRAVATQTWSTTARGTALELQTTADSTTTQVTRLQVLQTGQITMPANIAATSTTTGTLVVTGGVGVSGTIHAGAFDGDLTGNATTATTLQTTRSIGLSGVTATAQNFNGSANITIPITAVPASLLTGTIADARISGSYTGLTNLTGTGTVDFSRFIGNGADSASAPSFSWTGDLDTGIYTPAANQVAVSTGNSQAALFTSSRVTVTPLLQASNGVAMGSAVNPVYEINLDFGSDVAGTWRKIIGATLQDTQFSTHGFVIEIEDPGSNIASANTVNSIERERFYVAMVRAESTTLNTPDACYVTGPSNRIRAIKTAIGTYEVQIQNDSQFREYRVSISTYASNGSHTITYFDGTAGGTATGTYAATVGTATEWFQQVKLASTTASSSTTTGALTVAGGVGVAGQVTAATFSGSGAALTSLNASNLSSGTVPNARISGSYDGIDVLTANDFIAASGGVALRMKDSTGATGVATLVYSDGADFYFLLTNSGDANGTWNTLRPFRFSKTTGLVQMAHGLTVTGTVTGTTFSGSGASLTSLNASNLSTGTVGTARLGSGTANSTTFLRGDGTWAVPTASGDLTPTSVTSSGSIIGTTNLIARGGGTGAEGGQLVLGYGNNLATAITGQANNTWNLDVVTSDFRIFRLNSAGTALTAVQISEAGSAAFQGNIASTTTGTGTIVVTGGVGVSGQVTAGAFSGSGASLTSLNASNLGSGTVPDARISGAYSGITTLTLTSGLILPDGSAATPAIRFTNDTDTGIWLGAVGDMRFSVGGSARMTMTATEISTANGAAWTGNGSGLANLNASNLTSGTIPDARISGAYTGITTLSITSNLTVQPSTTTHGYTQIVPGNATNSGYIAFHAFTSGVRQGYIGYSATNSTLDAGTIPYVAGTHAFTGTISGNGSGLTTLNASNLSSGTVPDARISGAYSGITTLTLTSGLILPDGTSGTPAIRFTSDTNCGIYRHTTDTVGVNTALYVNGEITAFSDRRVKTNVESVPDALLKVQAIRGVTYERTDLEDGKRYAGVIAQEVEQVLPEVVRTGDDGMKSVNYDGLSALLIEAIKELSDKVKALEAKLAKYE